MKTLLIIFVLQVSSSAFAQDTFSIITKTTPESYTDVYPLIGNLYGRALVTQDGDEVDLICFVSPNLSNGYQNKTAPDALEGGGLKIGMTLYKFQNKDTCEKTVKEIDAHKGENILILFTLSALNPTRNF